MINNEKSFFKSSHPSDTSNTLTEEKLTPELEYMLNTDLISYERIPSSSESEESPRKQDESLNEMIDRLAGEDELIDKDFDVRSKNRISFTKYFFNSRDANEHHYMKDLEISAIFFLIFSFSFLLIIN